MRRQLCFIQDQYQAFHETYLYMRVEKNNSRRGVVCHTLDCLAKAAPCELHKIAHADIKRHDTIPIYLAV